MNRFFEFSKGQAKILTVLSAVVFVLGNYALVRDYYLRPSMTPRPWRVESLDGYQPTLVLDLNRCPAESLELIPWIGPSLAQRIVAYRQDHGPFVAVESLANVTGVGPTTVERVRRYFRVTTP